MALASTLEFLLGAHYGRDWRYERGQIATQDTLSMSSSSRVHTFLVDTVVRASSQQESSNPGRLFGLAPAHPVNSWIIAPPPLR